MTPGQRTVVPEWRPHRAVWLAWPGHAEEWLGDLDPPRRSVAELCAALAGGEAGEAIEMLVLDEAGERSARQHLGGLAVRYHSMGYGDIWLRDTGPVFVAGADASSGVEAACFGWNGWGGKYLFEHDAEVGERIAREAGIRATRHDWVLEGGAVECDGEGTLLTTRQCLLAGNRNPGVDRAEMDRRLAASLGAERVLWLESGLINDHTDGHVDTLVRFVAPGRVVCMRAGDHDDPNRTALEDIARDLRKFRDARGRALEVVDIPSPGRVLGPDGALAPASYVNYYVGNRTVVVPTYGTRHDASAVATIDGLYPGREVVGLDARAILVGGGAFHCITRDQPENPEEAP